MANQSMLWKLANIWTHFNVISRESYICTCTALSMYFRGRGPAAQPLWANYSVGRQSLNHPSTPKIIATCSLGLFIPWFPTHPLDHGITLPIAKDILGSSWLVPCSINLRKQRRRWTIIITVIPFLGNIEIERRFSLWRKQFGRSIKTTIALSQMEWKKHVQDWTPFSFASTRRTQFVITRTSLTA